MIGALTAVPAQAAPAPGYQPPPATFGPCTSASLVAAGAQCGFVTVPLDYADPGGRKITIAISRITHKTSQSQGVMLVNPGGPGGSGLALSRLQSRVPNGAGNAYDWIGFDPRGVGASEPALSCDKTYAGFNRPYYVATQDPRAEAAWLAKTSSYTAACAVAGRDLLPHLKTTDTVEDMESIRKALGEQQINFYGFSYGTYLGTVYATLHPQQVRRMVLDGVVDPSRVWEQGNDDQDVAFERSVGVFFGWVAKYDAVYHLGTTAQAVRARYDEQYQKLRTQPAGGLIGSSEWNDIFLQAGYYVYGWEDIASAFSAWVNQQNPAGLLALYPAPTDDNGYAVYLGVQCTDAPWSRYPAFRAQNAALFPKAPFETWANAWFNAPCTFWPAPAGRPTVVNGAAAPPILLVSETLDAATPYSGALAVRRSFPQSRLVEGTGGTTHAGTLQGQAPCEDQIVANYLASGALPARTGGGGSDAQCAPTPQPTPTAVTLPTPTAATAKAAASAVTAVAPQRWLGN
ncbi:alpha/beta fold hydrolase [Actinomycetospora chiangmaiensis]|uniref:alpha/beta fold hydrolase n=1 Tax=Actinomycetospora chiangmaiensis TaxID=402650 RepID=UPI00036296E9|nr:alpha/beta fold hydrolase [Actinomycetospora chiangmaiensis]